MFDFLAGLLAELYKLWPSFGGAIILFTALIMLALSPLSIKSTRSMIAMQRVGPEVKKLQQKHKGDREALNREMMEFYKEHNINPFSSCLPLLLQIPVFFVLYQVLIGLTRRVDAGDPLSRFNPKYLEGENTPLAEALRATNEMMSFGMDLSQSAWTELRTGDLLVALPFVVLVGLVVATAVIQQRQVQGRNPAAAVNPQQQMIAKIIPFIFVPISVSLPAGVVIYFVVSNLVRIGQQALVTRLDFKHHPPTGSGGDTKPSKVSPPGNGAGGAAAKLKKGIEAGKGVGANGRGRAKGSPTDAAKGNAKTPARGSGRAAASKSVVSKGATKKSTPSKGSVSKGSVSKGPSGTNGAGVAASKGNASKGNASKGNASKGNGGKAPVPAPRPRKRKRKRR